MALQRADDHPHPRAQRSLDHYGITSPEGGKQLRLEGLRVFRVAAAALARKRLPERTHKWTAAEHQIDAVREHDLGQILMKSGAAGAKLEHIAEHRDPAAA